MYYLERSTPNTSKKGQTMYFKDRKPNNLIYYVDGDEKVRILSQRRLTETQTFKITREMREAIIKIAEHADITTSDVIRNAIEYALPKMAEELRKRGDQR